VVADICPREEEFVVIMDEIRKELVKVVYGDPEKYTAVLFTGSGTIIQDVLVNSLIPEGKKICIVNNGAYSARMHEIAQSYNIACVNLEFAATGLPDLDVVKQTLEADEDIAVVATTHHETGTGVLNPVKEIGKIAHDNGCVFVADTISVLGPEGACWNDRCILDSRQNRRNQKSKGLSQTILLLQSLHAI
jgi:2-aminoethylphosphonate-pyruvate transaminase